MDTHSVFICAQISRCVGLLRQMKLARLCAQRATAGNCLLALMSRGTWYSRPGLPSIKSLILLGKRNVLHYLVTEPIDGLLTRSLEAKVMPGIDHLSTSQYHLQSFPLCLWTLKARPMVQSWDQLWPGMFICPITSMNAQEGPQRRSRAMKMEELWYEGFMLWMWNNEITVANGIWFRWVSDVASIHCGMSRRIMIQYKAHDLLKKDKETVANG